MAKTKKERATEMLNRLDSWKKITNELGKGGSVYDALTEFMKTNSPQMYNNHKRRFDALKTEESNLRSSVQNLENTVQELGRQHESKSFDLANIQTQYNNTKKDHERVTKNKTQIESYIKELYEKGIDSPFLEKIASYDIKTKEEIHTRLNTLEHYKTLKTDIDRLETIKTDKGSEINLLNTSRDNLQRDLNNIKKQFKESEERNKIQGSLTQISEQAISQGLTPTSFRMLISTLNDIGRSSNLDLNGLILGYRQYGNLKIIEDTLTNRSAEVERLRTEKEKIEGDLQALQETIVKKINEAWLDGLDRLERVESEQTTLVNQHAQRSLTQVDQVNRKLLTNLEKLDKDLFQWGEIMRQAGKLEDPLKLAYIIQGIGYTPNAAIELSVHEVAQMAFIVDTWAKAHWKDVKEAPSPATVSLCFLLSKFSQYELVAFTQFIAEEFEKRIRT